MAIFNDKLRDFVKVCISNNGIETLKTVQTIDDLWLKGCFPPKNSQKKPIVT